MAADLRLTDDPQVSKRPVSFHRGAVAKEGNLWNLVDARASVHCCMIGAAKHSGGLTRIVEEVVEQVAYTCCHTVATQKQNVLQELPGLCGVAMSWNLQQDTLRC